MINLIGYRDLAKTMYHLRWKTVDENELTQTVMQDAVQILEENYKRYKGSFQLFEQLHKDLIEYRKFIKVFYTTKICKANALNLLDDLISEVEYYFAIFGNDRRRR